MKHNWISPIFVIIRIAIGCFFVFSGAEKLIQPYQNFLYVVQSYEVLPSILEELTARIVPWAELFLGLFLALGLWTEKVLPLMLVLVTIFIGIVAQAIVRNLPITECGCFGEALHVPLHVVILFDSMLWVFLAGLLLRREKSLTFSLDRYFLNHSE